MAEAVQTTELCLSGEGPPLFSRGLSESFVAEVHDALTNSGVELPLKPLYFHVVAERREPGEGLPTR